jgi:hypothetical protein
MQHYDAELVRDSEKEMLKPATVQGGKPVAQRAS